MTGRDVLLAIEPVVLEGALAQVLVQGGVPGVTVYHERDPRPSGHYRMAVTTGSLPANVTADVVITLPLEGRGGTAIVHVDGDECPEPFASPFDLLRLVKLHVLKQRSDR
jgi:hypothetical protein